MKKFADALFDFTKSLNKTNTIYVLKGFNAWMDDIAGNNFFLGKQPIQNEISKEKISELSKSDEPKLMLFENLIYLTNQNQLGGILTFTNYKVIIIENDYFDGYFPDFQVDNSDRLLQFNDENDNLIQTYYGDMQVSEEILFVNYNQIYEEEFRMIQLSKELSIFEGNIEKSGTLYKDIDAITFQGLIYEILDLNYGKIVIENDKGLESKVNNLKKKFSNTNIIFEEVSSNLKIEIDSDDYKEYVSILKRKNQEYDFLDIDIYEDPYESTDLEKVNQSQIIDRLVKNSIASQKDGEKFRDIFVTAPTGAGKSVMFQIPAIFLAEKFNLVTIVISPLIGLMNDQVENIKKLTLLASAINSDYTPIEKDQVLESIKNGEKSILYLSPETLLSNTDITNLIGDRKIGLLVVDEAHIVATWGKSFRPDYWYLGEFISKLRKSEKTNQNFPIATFTATSTFGGDDNMFIDIVESLKMTPERYLGKVKRDDIHFDIRYQQKKIDYQGEKLETAADEINKLQENGGKTLAYVPYTKHIDELFQKMKNPNKTGKYFGRMIAGEKNETLEQIVNGEKNLVIATKAFGMGIDIDDIKNVYHFAPTGNITDYVQEIGRAARRQDMIGVASTDFYKEDFRYINQLFGMSSIKNWQIIAILSKILDLYRKHKKRNFLVSPMEFAYVFANEEKADIIDAQLKTSLLIIKKDFELISSSNYVPLIFKPRSMFTNGYFMIYDDFLPNLRSSGNLRFFKKIEGIPRQQVEMQREYEPELTISSLGDTYILDFKKLWEAKFKDESFANFKRLFFNNELHEFDFKVNEKLIARTIVEITARENMLEDVTQQLKIILNTVKFIFDDIRQLGKHFTVKQLAEDLKKKISFKNTYTADLLAQSIIFILNNVPVSNLNSSKFATYNSQTEKWNIQNSTYEVRIKRIVKQALSVFNLKSNKSVMYVPANSNSKNNNLTILLAQIVEILELADVEIRSGDSPEFFIRVNNPNAIEKVIRNKYYQSNTVELVRKKHIESTQIMEYFFTVLKFDDERWDFIEKYFLGQIDVDNLSNYIEGSSVFKEGDTSVVSKEIELTFITKEKFPYKNWNDAECIQPNFVYRNKNFPVPDFYAGEVKVDENIYPYLYVWEDKKMIVFDSEEAEFPNRKIGDWKIISEDELKFNEED